MVDTHNYTRRQKLINLGLCVQCGKKNDSKLTRCPKCNSEHSRGVADFRKDNHEYCKIKDGIRQLKSKEEIIKFYSFGTMQCKLCDELRLGALTLDHIDGGGRKHRQTIGYNDFYAWIRRNRYPSGYQVLCSNHNWKKWITATRLKIVSNYHHDRWQSYAVALKTKFMNVLGGKCVECNIDDIDILTVHHINNDGKKHRAKVSSGSGSIRFYRAILKSNDFSGLECRCFSCNDVDQWTSKYQNVNLPG